MEDTDPQLKSSSVYQNQPFDESLDIADDEEVASVIEPTPRALKQPPNIPEFSIDKQGSKLSDKTMSNDASEDFDNNSTAEDAANRPTRPLQANQFEDEDEDEETEGSTESDDDDDDEDHPPVEGAYNPADYENLNVSKEVSELFAYIQRYTPQTIELEHRLKPFIPEYIPAVGDIDAFIKIPRPDLKPDNLGLLVLDEPCANQADPTVLDLQLRAVSRITTNKEMAFRSLQDAEKKPKEVEKWIKSITDLIRSKPPASVHYQKNMPDIETLMQEWPAEFEEMLKEVSLPGSDLECDLSTYVDVICGILDIPVHNNRIHSLHVLFTLFSEFKNSQHFQTMAQYDQLENNLK